MNARKICTAYNIEIDKHKYKKDRPICKNCFKKKKLENNNLVSEKDAKVVSSSNKQITDNKASVSAYGHHLHVIIDPSNVGKTYFMLKILEKKVKKDLFK